MKKFVFIALAAFSVIGTTIKAQVKMPAPSTTQTIRQDFGLGTIELVYSRPNIKGRSLLMNKSELVPLGQLWRTGANAATRIHFSDNVSIGGHALDTGSYVIYTIPNKSDWTIIINRGIKNWGTVYNQDEDVFRITVPSMNYSAKTETFTMNFVNITNTTCDLQLTWGNTAVNIPITTNINDRIRASIESGLMSDKKPYYQASTFYYEIDHNNAKALENINKAIGENPKAFWMYLQKAKIQKSMGDKAGAKMSAQQVITFATEAKNNDYVGMANDLIKSM